MQGLHKCEGKGGPCDDPKCEGLWAKGAKVQSPVSALLVSEVIEEIIPGWGSRKGFCAQSV